MIHPMIRSGALLTALLALGACTRPAEERTVAELDVGRASGDGLTVEVADGLAHIRALGDRHLELWSQAPVLDVTLTVDDAAAGEWTVRIRNAMPDAALTAPPEVAVAELLSDLPTVKSLRLTLPTGTHRLHLAPPDADVPGRFRVAALADIQTGLDQVDQLFARIDAEPGIRFAVVMGDLTDRAEITEFDLLEQQLTRLDVPFYATRGNHDLWNAPSRFRERFGRGNFQFVFKDVAFTFVDSGDAGIDPLVYDWLDDWLAAARDRVHVFLTHFPPIDPIGIRMGSFRSRREGHMLLSRLADAGVDLTLYGHIHTYYAFDNAGIPAYISGGGGARPERWDGIDRHFLVIELDPEGDRIGSVGLVRL
jgi:Icc-related predicted phosphoesterase